MRLARHTALLRVLPWLLLAALPMPAQAQTAYRVEVLAFTRPLPDGADAELPREEQGRSPIRQVVRLNEAPGYNRLAPEGLRLRGVAAALSRADSIKPVLHLAWRQPAAGRSTAAGVVVAGGPLRGQVRVYRERFVHVDVNLGMQTDEGVYQLLQSRRLKTDEIHYLDHPGMGLLVLVTELGGD